MDKRKILIQVGIVLVLVSMYVVKDFFIFDAEVPEQKQQNIEVEQISSQALAASNEQETSEEIIFHYAAETPNPNKTVPRQKFDLDMPQITRSEKFDLASIRMSDKADMSYFEDAIFLGDGSISDFQDYVAEQRLSDSSYFVNSKFVAIKNYSVYEAIQPVSDSSIHISLDGVKLAPEQIIEKYNAKKVFICLGMNDVGNSTVDEFIDNYKKLIKNIMDINKDVKIIIQTIPPVTLYGEKQSIYNAKIDTYNEALIELITEKNIYLADPAFRLKDTSGYLAIQLCSDDISRLNKEAYTVWVEYLLNHAIQD